MAREVAGILLSIILIGVVVAGCAIGAATDPSKTAIEGPSTWSLQALGYSDLDFPCERSRESISVEFMLPEDAAQGPEKWYILQLHFSIQFGEESKVADPSSYGRTYVSAGTNGYTCAQIKFINEEQDGEIVIKWGTGSENLLGPSTDSTTSLEVEDVQFANYLRTLGVLPGKNVLTVTLEQYDGAKVESLTIFADSGIECTLQPPSWWEEETEAWETLLTEEEATTLEVALSDPRVQELLEGKNYTIDQFGLYELEETVTSESRTLTRRGSRVDILFDTVHEIEYDWPWPPGRQRHRMERVPDLDIIIDMDKWEVIGISPTPQSWGTKTGRLRPLVRQEFTEEEKEEAIQIVLNEEHVQELLQGKNYTVRRVGVWREGQETVGAVVAIGFDQLYFIDYNWPRWDSENEQRVYLHRAVHVEGIVATVDFRSGEVIEVTDSPVLTSKEGTEEGQND
jgi:hypothetical protein